jgi:ATP-dependent Clp protease ATP-binding subunit ClpA
MRGYDKKMGARPMARVIQEHIKRPLAEELLFGKLAEGGHVRVEVAADGESLELTVEPLKRELEDLRGKGSAQRELAGHKGEE